MTSNGNNLMKWGVLISVFHIYVFGSFEIIPAFIGYFLIMRGIYSICEETGLDYLQGLKGESTRLLLFSVIYWVTGIFIGYSLVLQKLIMVVFYLFDVLFFGNFLNKTIKYYKEKMRIREADKLRKARMTFVKCYLALIVFYIITMLPNLLHFMNIGSVSMIEMLSTVLQYVFVSLMLILKLFLSMLLQKYSF